MTNEFVIALSIKLVFGFIAAIISILLWSKTRDGAWLTMVLGVVSLYVKTLFDVLNAFGFIFYDSIQFSGVEVVPLIFETIPFIFFAIGMFLFLYRIRKY